MHDASRHSPEAQELLKIELRAGRVASATKVRKEVFHVVISLLELVGKRRIAQISFSKQTFSFLLIILRKHERFVHLSLVPNIF